MYQTRSDFPPPPRRTPNPTGTWRSTASGASGADRFTNFPKPAPTSKKNPADPANVFNAWQNMKSQTAGASPQPPPRPSPPKRPVPNPPPRRDTRFPTEEDIRAGTTYREAPPRGSGGFRSAWAEYNGAGTGNPGASTSSGTPKKSGFDPTSTGDEGQAGDTSNYSSSRRKSEDPPYYPPPPPRSASQKNYSDVPAGDARTSYAGEDARRTASTPYVPTAAGGPSQFRQSTRKAGTGTARKPFVVYSSSDDSETEDDSVSSFPDTVQKNSQPTTTDQPADHFARSFTRPKKTPNPPSRQFKNGVPYEAPGEAGESSNPVPEAAGDAGGQNKPTMYANHFPSFPPNKPYKMPTPVYPFGRNYQHNKSPESIPQWAVPSSIPPVKRSHSAAQRAWVDLTNAESANVGRSQPTLHKRPQQPPVPDEVVDLSTDDIPELQSPYKKTCFTKDDATGLYCF